MKLKIKTVKLDTLHEDPGNVRKHGPKNLAAIRDSLTTFGQVEPLVVQQKTGLVIGGNGRLAAMRDMGWQECDVVEIDADDTKAARIGIALNRTGELAEWDSEALAKLLQSIPDDELGSVGFDAKELNDLIAKLDEGVKELDDTGPDEPEERAVTRRGDLWLLGGSRILNGDSTNPEDMARLMNGEQAVLLATDPPYLVDYQGGNHPLSSVNKPDVKDKHWGDYVDPESSVAFFADFLRVALAHCIERVPVYQWHATRRQVFVEEAWKANGLLVHQTLIWVKARGVLTYSHYLWSHEPAFYGWREGSQPEKDRRPDPSQRTVWEINQAGEEKGLHPTMKPLEIFERPIVSHTRRGEIVLEPFSGSGTQLIAAEKHGRRCYAMELSPAFVDVDVKRWQRATGLAATLDGDGRTFDQVAAERMSGNG